MGGIGKSDWPSHRKVPHDPEALRAEPPLRREKWDAAA